MNDPQKQATSFFKVMESKNFDIMDMAVTIRVMSNLVASKAEEQTAGKPLVAAEHVRIPFDG
ncbi:hypothetical protein [uncultured Sneathiella sp.]|uniref:hypothetical protein n=1 Tax=uncultured Sneathiella sp. TaxID=879315 RepID=UPI0030EF2652|tara:strand:+ start:2375 stop:2560 length:186 start_codon:yes stop_codon:yes gene_type:complete